MTDAAFERDQRAAAHARRAVVTTGVFISMGVAIGDSSTPVSEVDDFMSPPALGCSLLSVVFLIGAAFNRAGNGFLALAGCIIVQFVGMAVAVGRAPGNGGLEVLAYFYPIYISAVLLASVVLAAFAGWLAHDQ